MVSPPLPGGAASRHPLTSVLDPLLLDVLACPAEHHTPLVPGEPDNALAMSLSCPECGRIFDVRDGIPVLLLDEARYGPDRSTPGPDESTPGPVVSTPGNVVSTPGNVVSTPVDGP